jgi:hypothetical protein
MLSTEAKRNILKFNRSLSEQDLENLTQEQVRLVEQASHHVQTMLYQCNHCGGLAVSGLVGPESEKGIPEGLFRGNSYFGRGMLHVGSLCKACDDAMNAEIDAVHKGYGLNFKE